MVRKIQFIFFAFFLLCTLNIFSQELSPVWPKPDQMVLKDNVEFLWNKANDVDYYHFELYQGSTDSLIIQFETIDTNTINFTLPLMDIYYWRVKAFLNDNTETDWSGFFKFEWFLPNNIEKLIFWLSADSLISIENDLITNWGDLSNNSLVASQINPANKPTLLENAINNFPAVHFDGGSFFDLPLSETINQPNTLFILWESTGSGLQFAIDGDISSSRRVLYAQGGTSNRIGIQTSSNLQYNRNVPFSFLITTAIFNLNNSSIYENGVHKNTGNVGTEQPLNHLKIGARYGNASRLVGNISEIIFIDSLLYQNDREKVESYLRNKYTPQVNLGLDITNNTSFCDINLDAGPYFESYLWSTGQNTNSIQVNKSGVYSVTVTDVFGYESSDTIHVYFPNKIINYQDTIICYGDSLNIFPLIEKPEDFIYEWNNGATSYSLYISEPGSYWVKITDSLGCYNYSDTINIEVDYFPTDTSLGPDLELCSGNILELVYFDGMDSESISYSWSTGSSSSFIPIYESGNYSVTVTNVNNCIGTDEIYIEIIGTAPDPDFIATLECLGIATGFTDLSMSSDDDAIIFWQWSFDDNETSFEQNPFFTFIEPGIYPIELYVEAESGCNNKVIKEIEVLEIPSSNFSVLEGCVGYPVIFIDESTNPENNQIVSWHWDFGDGETSQEQNPQHIFEIMGLQNVTLTTSLENECSDTISKSFNLPDNIPIPDSFTLVYPKQDQILNDQEIDFSWNFPSNTYSFYFQVSTDSSMDEIIFSAETFENFLHFNLPSNNEEYFWRVKAFNACRDTITSKVNNFSIFSPSSLDSLILWLSADSLIITENEYVTEWGDLSGNSHNAVQENISSSPKIIQNSLNHYPVINFNGVSQFMQVFFSNSYQQPLSLFLIWESHDTGAGLQFPIDGLSLENRLAVYAQGGSGNRLGIQTTGNLQYSKNVPFNYIITTGLFDTQNSKIFENSLIRNSGNVGLNHIINGLTLGANFSLSNRLTGNIAEILLFNKTIDNYDRLKVENYLKGKYSPPVNLSFDRNITYGFCPVILDAGERFESYLWNTGETSQSIEVLEAGIYSVTVTDIFGSQSTDSVEVKFPSYGLNVAEVTVCLGTEVELSWGDGRPGTAETQRARSARNTERQTLNAKQDIPPAPFEGGVGSQELQSPVSGLRSPVSDYTFLWSTGDTTATITVTETGTYTLLVTDTIGCAREFSALVFVDDFEVSATLGEPRPFCMGDTLYVESVWDPALLSHVWNDGSTLPGLPINQPGDYSVIATNPNGCVAETATSLSFQGNAPEVDFTATIPCFGELSLFTGTSSAEGSEIVTRLWYFGDPGNEGATDSGEDVSYTYSQPGIFNATLQVESAAGCSRSKTLPAQVYHLPESWFTPNNACTDVPVLFNDASADMEGGISQWQWSFYDTDGSLAGQSTEAAPEFIFNTPGTAHVELVATSIVGCNDTISRAINIKESPAIAFDFTTPCLGEPVFFTDNTVAPPWALITGQQWDFGDGNTSAQSNPSHMYQNDGIFDVTLNVTAINGCAPSLTRQVTVHSPPEAAFATPGLCVNTPHTFMDETTVENSTITQWHWDFAGQGSSNQQFPEFSFGEPGQYMVSLTATSEAGCSGSITQPIEVHPAPVSEFTFFPRWGVAPLTVSFTNLSQGANLYSWDFGDGNPGSANVNPSHTYTENGVYLAQLTAFTELGCADNTTQEIKVIPLSIDIAVTDVGYRVENNFMQVYVNLQNLGTLEFDTLHLEFHLSGRDPIRETWTGMLMPGKTTQYTFNAQLAWRDNYTHFCVEAFIPRGPEETNNENNRLCLSFVDEFRLLPAFPNPADGYVNIGFILPYSERVTIQLSDIRGYTLATLYDTTTPQGITTLRIPIEHLSNGIYLYRVTFRDENKVGRFMKY